MAEELASMFEGIFRSQETCFNEQTKAIKAESKKSNQVKLNRKSKTRFWQAPIFETKLARIELQTYDLQVLQFPAMIQVADML